MTDIDFDELDKAVNSLMKEPAALTPSSEPTPTPTPSVKEPVAAPIEQPVKVASPVSPTPSTLPMKRTGRFMDVMHPSSDMGNAKSPVASRTGVTINPLNIPTPEPSKAIEQPENTSINEPISTPTTAAPSDVSADSSSTMPDPLNFVPGQPAQEVAAESTPLADAATLPDTNTPAPVVDATPSPFLPDAKVEKRPLGNGSKPVDELPADMAIAAEPEVDEAKAEPSDDVAAKTVLSAELGSEINAIEADAPHEKVPASTAETAPALDASVGISIPQQYKEKVQSGDQSHAPIYDTNVQPLAHPVRKKSGWGVVLWILLIILLCVGIAAGLYFAGIIKLPM